LIPAATTYTTPQGITHAYGGIMGILGAAGVVFFAYIGFDAVSTAAQEARIRSATCRSASSGSLVVCTVLYVLFSYVLSGVATVAGLPLAPAAKRRWRSRSANTCRLRVALEVGHGRDPGRILVGHPGDVARPIARLLFDEPRRPGAGGFLRGASALPHALQIEPALLRLHRSVGRVRSGGSTGEMTSIGTLFAFILVCAGVWIMRVRRPELERGFRVPALPLVAISASSSAAR
jgi:APA family basic amino acid/polyamine antiporter